MYTKGYKDTGEYRFRMNAGDIAIMLAKMKLETLDGEQRREAEQECFELERSEYSKRVEQYPSPTGCSSSAGARSPFAAMTSKRR